MKILRYGDRGSLVSLLQKGLERAGFELEVDGIFGEETRRQLTRFQRREGLTEDGVAGPATDQALGPWYRGYTEHVIRPGDTLWSIAGRYGSRLALLESANPGIDPFRLMAGQRIVVPFAFPVVPGDVPVSGELVGYCVEGLVARYPLLRAEEVGRSELGLPLWTLRFGEGPRRVFFSAAHHANEWITALLLLRYTEDLADALVRGEAVGGASAESIYERCQVTLLPLVDPDGVDLVTGALGERETAYAAAIAAAFPTIPFPGGWKANLPGTDLNLQYPALWDEAREVKFAQGFDRPAPRDYVGAAPLSARESRAVYELTERLDPALLMAFHTQGEVIYWKFQDREPPGSRELAVLFSAVSGYALEDVPYASSFAGLKDWFILRYDRPGFTVEAGRGQNPLPLTELGEMIRRCTPMMTLAALGEVGTA